MRAHAILWPAAFIVVAAGAGIGSAAAAGAFSTATTVRTVVIKPAAEATTVPPRVVTVTPKPAATPAASVATSPAAPAQPSQPQLTNASAVVLQFYQDITDGNYAAAWALGGDNIGGNDYAAWEAGYQNTTASISVTSESSFGSGQVDATISALQLDGSVRTYSGTYTVDNGVIVGADITRTS